jgi:hypothetical protein
MHYDNQYCESFTVRSIYTILIYLSTMKETDGGQTEFYSTSTKYDTKGLTVQEELSLSKTTKLLTVSPTASYAVIFPHTILHAGLPVLSSRRKYVMRTDLVFYCPSFDLPEPISLPQDYQIALQLFREAQLMELQGESGRASRLYERALSYRRHYGKKTTVCTDPNTQENWMWIFKHLSLEDLSIMRQTSKQFQVWSQRYMSLMWKQIQLKTKTSTITVARYYKPLLTHQKGTYSYFKYDSPFFERNEAACLRVLACYTLFASSSHHTAKTFIARYDRLRQTVLQCSLEWFLKCAFYQLPCDGSFYALPETNAFDVRRPFLRPVLPLQDENVGYDDRDLLKNYDDDTQSAWNQDSLDLTPYIHNEAEKKKYQQDQQNSALMNRTGYTFKQGFQRINNPVFFLGTQLYQLQKQFQRYKKVVVNVDILKSSRKYRGIPCHTVMTNISLLIS